MPAIAEKSVVGTGGDGLPAGCSVRTAFINRGPTTATIARAATIAVAFEAMITRKVLAGPKVVTVDGIKGTEIDLQATKDAPTVYCKDPCVALWPLDPGHPAALSTDGVARIVAIRLNGETVSIECGAPNAGFAALARHFDAMLQTVRFG